MHPGAVLPLLWHGYRQPRLHYTRRGDDLPGEAFDAASVLETIELERCTALHGVPTMFIGVLQHPDFGRFNVASLRTGIMAGSPCPIEVMRRVIGEMGMHEITIGYGMTETSPLSFQSRPKIPSSAASRLSGAFILMSR